MVRVGVNVRVMLGVMVGVGVLVAVGVRVAVAVFVGVRVRVGVRVMVGVALGSGVGVMVGFLTVLAWLARSRRGPRRRHGQLDRGDVRHGHAAIRIRIRIRGWAGRRTEQERDDGINVPGVDLLVAIGIAAYGNRLRQRCCLTEREQRLRRRRSKPNFASSTRHTSGGDGSLHRIAP